MGGGGGGGGGVTTLNFEPPNELFAMNPIFNARTPKMKGLKPIFI